MIKTGSEMEEISDEMERDFLRYPRDLSLQEDDE